jgi:hypothetical protein
VDPDTQVDLSQAILITPAFDQRVDVLVVQSQLVNPFCSPRQVSPAWIW